MTENDLIKICSIVYYIIAKSKNIELADDILVKNCIKDSKMTIKKFNNYFDQFINNTNVKNN